MSKANQRQKKEQAAAGSSVLSALQMPSKPELEMAVLGAVIHRPELLGELLGIIDSNAFYSQAHQYIWSAYLGLKKEGRPIDLVLLNEELTRRSVLEVCGGVTYLVKVSDSVASPSHALEWAQELKGYAQRRKLMQAGAALIEQAADMETDPRTLALDAQEATQSVLDDSGKAESCRPADFVDDWVEGLEKLQEQGGPLVRVQYKDMQNILAGLFPGEQTVLAGRPSTGKTALGANIIEYALTKGIGCGMFSLEMTKHALLNRLAASNKISGSGSEVEAMRFRDGRFSDADWNNVYGFAEFIQKMPLRIWDKPRLSPTDFYVQCRLWKKEIGLQLVLLDYLQLMEPDHRASSREREISEMSRSINHTVKELDLHILLLCQLNREAEKSKRPLLSHLRESGSLEQDADNVIFIVPWRSEDGQEMVPVEVDIAKGRNNSVGTVHLSYRRKYLQFVSPAANQEDLDPWNQESIPQQ